MSAVEFRKHAAEHLDWARTAKSDRERQTFQQMAEAWLEAAASLCRTLPRAATARSLRHQRMRRSQARRQTCGP